MSRSAVGYVPYSPVYQRSLWTWIERTLDIDVSVLDVPRGIDLNAPIDLPDRRSMAETVAPIVHAAHVVVEGPGGLLWGCLLRAAGFRGALTVIAHVNPAGWHDVKAIALFRHFVTRVDRIFAGSPRAATIYRALGLPVLIGYPFGIDADTFTLGPDAACARRSLGLGSGPLLVYAGRVETDKAVHTLLRVAIKARLLFPELRLAIAAAVIDPAYENVLAPVFAEGWVSLVRNPAARELAALYGAADAFVTAATSHFETFGRAPVEAMACGATAIAPRYDGFCETLAQPGGVLVNLTMASDDVAVDEAALLRAVYDTLSSPPAASRASISATARARFAREHTIELLAYLASAPAARETCDPLPVPVFPLPAAWHAAVRDLQRRPPLDALDRALEWKTDVHLCDADAVFRQSVRRALAGAAA